MRKRIIFIIVFILSVFNIFLSWYFRDLNLCTYNNGFAFNISFVGIEVLSILFLIILVLLYLKSDSWLRYNVGLLILLGTSNLLERVIFSDICDYINIFNMSINILDISFVSIVIYLIIRMFKESYGSRD